MNQDPQAHSAELQAILQNQQALSTLRTAVVQLEAAIQQQQAEAQLVQNVAEELANLQARREDMLADIATGQDRRGALLILDSQIERHKADSAAVQGTHEQTISGLTRRLERSQAELSQLQEAQQKLIRALLCQRAEVFGAEYVQAAQKLSSLYRQITGLGVALVNHGGTQSIGGGATLQVPSFALDSVRPHAIFQRPHLIVSGIETHGESMALAKQEENRLSALGIDLG